MAAHHGIKPRHYYQGKTTFKNLYRTPSKPGFELNSSDDFSVRTKKIMEEARNYSLTFLILIDRYYLPANSSVGNMSTQNKDSSQLLQLLANLETFRCP